MNKKAKREREREFRIFFSRAYKHDILLVLLIVIINGSITVYAINCLN